MRPLSVALLFIFSIAAAASADLENEHYSSEDFSFDEEQGTSSSGSWAGESISADDGQGIGDEAPRHSGSDLKSIDKMFMPDPRDALDSCVHYFPRGRYNRPPKKAPNSNYHFFFDLEDTIYTRRKVQMNKIAFYRNFLEKQLLVTDEAEIKDIILNQKAKLQQLLDFKSVKFEDPYTFITPDRTVTELVSSIKAQRWIFTKSNVDHAKRVLKEMKLTQYFSGIIFSPPGIDYGKTQAVFYEFAALATGLKTPRDAFFIDDSVLNVFMALNLKWHAMLYYNPVYHKKLPPYYDDYSKLVHRVSLLRHIKEVYPQLFSKRSLASDKKSTNLRIVFGAAFYELKPRNSWDLGRPVMMFDLDNTLYQGSPQMSQIKHDLAIRYLLEHQKGITPQEAELILTHFRAKYDGVFTRGVIEMGLNGSDFERYLDSNLNLAKLVKTDPRLQNMLGNINARLYVLTNSGLGHAMGALKALGILDRFHGIVYVDYGRPLFSTKPEAQIYHEAMRYANVDCPSDVYFVDDQLAYAQMAKRLGWNAVYLNNDGKVKPLPGQSLPMIRSIYDLPTALPTLFRA